jgi:hypothetical protein
MTRIALVLALALTVLARPAIAQMRLIESVRIAHACAGDVLRLCGGVHPGGGRITACVKEKLGQLSSPCFELLLGALVARKQPPAMRLNPGVVADKQVHLDNARGYAYCEFAPVVGPPSNLLAQFYNTTGTTGITGQCPADTFAAINGKTLANKLGAAVVYLNPTPQTARRHWVMDQFWVFRAGETVEFEGVKATWIASMTPHAMLAALSGGAYSPTEIHRTSKYLYANGSTVFLIRTPEEKTYIMQSYATEVDPSLTFDRLAQLGSKLKLPAGWRFEAKTLDKELTIEPGKSGSVAHIIRDELHNVYEGCGFDATCSYVP